MHALHKTIKRFPIYWITQTIKTINRKSLFYQVKLYWDWVRLEYTNLHGLLHIPDPLDTQHNFPWKPSSSSKWKTRMSIPNCIVQTPLHKPQISYVNDAVNRYAEREERACCAPLMSTEGLYTIMYKVLKTWFPLEQFQHFWLPNHKSCILKSNRVDAAQ